MKNLFFLIALFVILTGCGTIYRASTGEHRHGTEIRSGILRVGLEKLAFLDVWGEPDRVNTISGQEVLQANWGGLGGGGLFKGKKTLEQWTYEQIGVQLVFNNRALVAWQTDRTVSELKAVAKPRRVDFDSTKPYKINTTLDVNIENE